MQQLSQDAAKSDAMKVVACASGGLAGAIAFLLTLMVGLDLVNRVFGLSFIFALVILVPVATAAGLFFGFTMYRGWFFASSLYPSQVYDYGDYLVVESNSERKRVRFTDIVDVRFSYLSPVTISITISSEGGLQVVVFLPNHQVKVREIVRSLKKRAAMA